MSSSSILDDFIGQQPFTEQSNSLTVDIDSCSADDIIKTLGKVDEEIFQGYSNWKQSHSLLHGKEFLENAEGLADLIAHAVTENRKFLMSSSSDNHNNKPNLHQSTEQQKTQKLPFGVVFAGCGTSGRVGFLLARGFNRALREQQQQMMPEFSSSSTTMFRYIMAGGDDALVLSIELPEDDPHDGKKSIQEFEQYFEKIIVVGITCGLSAPFVAGMLHYSSHHPTQMYRTVLVGFNPVELSRNTKIEKWKQYVDADDTDNHPTDDRQSYNDKTCRDVFTELKTRRQQQQEKTGTKNHHHHIFILTPIVGGEAITGSSRMKGGSATLVLLNAISAVGIKRATTALENNNCNKSSSSSSSFSRPATTVQTFLHDHFYEAVLKNLYSQQDSIKSLAAIASVAAEVVANNNNNNNNNNTNKSKHKNGIVTCGIDPLGSAGAIGIMDHSEAVDTFGCDDTEWRGLSLGSWEWLENQEGPVVGTRNRPPAATGKNKDDTAKTLPSLLNVDADACAERWLCKGDLLLLLDFEYSADDEDDHHNQSLMKVRRAKAIEFTKRMKSLSKIVGFKIARVTVTNSSHAEADHESADPTSQSERASSSASVASVPLDDPSLDCRIYIPSSSASPPSLKSSYNFSSEFAMKLAINAISTAAQTLRGNVFSNRMINVTVSNNKLFYRTLDMVKMFASRILKAMGNFSFPCDERRAQVALLKAIYRKNRHFEEIIEETDGFYNFFDESENKNNSNHDDSTSSNRLKYLIKAPVSIESIVVEATPLTNVLPIAVLLASNVVSTVEEAEKKLACSGSLRNTMKELMMMKSPSSSESSFACTEVADTVQVFERARKSSSSSDASKPTKYLLRSAKYPADVEGTYHICMKTGDSGKDGEPFYKDDPDALGRQFVGPYLAFEPRFGIVLENQDTKKLVGYSFGSLDTKKFFEESYEKHWRQDLIKAFPDPRTWKKNSLSSTKSTRTRAEEMYISYHSPDYSLPKEVDLEKYPAHLHIDLLEEAQGLGLGKRMLEEVMRRLRDVGKAKGVHLCMAKSNERALLFYKKLGFEELATRGDDLFMGKIF